MPCGSQVVTTEVLSDEMVQDGSRTANAVEDCNYLLDYYRITGDNRLLYGGGVVYGARSGQCRSDHSPENAQNLPAAQRCEN